MPIALDDLLGTSVGGKGQVATPPTRGVPLDEFLERPAEKSTGQKVIEGVNVLGKNLVQVADVVASLPAFAAGVGAKGALAAGFSLAKLGGAEGSPLKAADAAVEEAMQAPWMKVLQSPLQELITGTIEGDTTVSGLLNKLTEAREGLGHLVAQKTGNAEHGEAVKLAFDSALLGIPTLTRTAKRALPKGDVSVLEMREDPGATQPVAKPAAKLAPSVPAEAPPEAGPPIVQSAREAAKASAERVKAKKAAEAPMGEATWTSADGVDYPVEVTGAPVRYGKRYFTPVTYEGKTTFVPTKELKFPEPPKAAEPLPSEIPYEPPAKAEPQSLTLEAITERSPTYDTIPWKDIPPERTAPPPRTPLEQEIAAREGTDFIRLMDEMSKTREAPKSAVEEQQAALLRGQMEALKPMAWTQLMSAMEKAKDGTISPAEARALDQALPVKNGALLAPRWGDIPYQKGAVDPKLLAGILAAGGVAAFIAANPERTDEIALLAAGALGIKGKVADIFKPEQAARASGAFDLTPIASLDQLRAMRTAREVVTHLTEVAKSPWERELANRLKELPELTDKVTFTTLKQGDVVPPSLAGHIGKSDIHGVSVFNIRDQHARIGVREESASSEVLLHEVVHAVTQKRLYGDPVFASEVEGIRKTLVGTLKDLQLEGKITQAQYKDLRGLLPDAAEFMSATFTNATLRELLKGVAQDGRLFKYSSTPVEKGLRLPYEIPKPLSLFDSLLAAIAKIFGYTTKRSAEFARQTELMQKALEYNRTVVDRIPNFQTTLDRLLKEAQDTAGVRFDLGEGVKVNAARSDLAKLPEERLLALIQTGGKDAQSAAAELYRQSAPKIERTLQAKFGHQSVDIEAAVQEAIVDTLAKVSAGEFRGESSYSTYATRAAINNVLMELREAKSRPEHVSITEDAEGRTPVADSLGHQVTPEAEALQRTLGSRLEAAVDKLTPVQRDVFAAVVQEGMSYAEAAAHFGIPEKTVSSRLTAAYKALREELKDYADLETGATTFIPQRGRMPRMEGSADPRHLAALAALSGGAVLGAYLSPSDSQFKGALQGTGAAFAALVAAKNAPQIVAAVRRIQDSAPIVTIRELIGETAYQKKALNRAAFQMQEKILRTVPTLERRQAIYDWLAGEKPTQLNPLELELAREVRQYFDGMGKLAQDSGVVKTLLDDYATRIYPKAQRGLFESKHVGERTGIDSPFGKPRRFATMAEAEAAGYIPVTTDIAKVLEIYTNSVGNAIGNRTMIKALRDIRTAPTDALPDGAPLISKEAKAPSDYVFVDHPQLRGYRVHPDLAPDVRFIFDSRNPGAILSALDTINSTQKRLGVTLSLFHATALEHAMLGATSFLKAPVQGAKILGQAFAPVIFGENLMIRQIREGGLGDIVDRAMKDGLEFGFERQGAVMAEERPGLYKGMEAASRYLDETVPGAGKYTVGALLELNHAFDRAMWGRLHTALKLTVYADKMSELSRNNARMIEQGKAAPLSQAELGRAAASFTNDLFGGLNYAQILGEMKTRWSRELMSGIVSPSGRFAMRMLLFAPDWTISTTRAFVKAFGARETAALAGGLIGSQLMTDTPEHKLIGGLIGTLLGGGAAVAGGLKGARGSGLRGALPGELGGRAATLTDLHRQYVMRSAFLYTLIGDAINYQMSGHHFWENKDPTRLDRGDGTTMMLSKHFMEPFHWVIDPKKQAMGKASFILKEGMSQMTDSEYWSPKGAPRMGGVEKGQDIPIGTRLGHAARQFTPISAQGFDLANPQKAAWSIAGMPVYGRTHAERAAAKEKLRELHATPEYQAAKARRAQQRKERGE